jgi:DNA polymerase I
MSGDEKIVCSRIVFPDSEFDAKVGRGEIPGFPICICAIEIDENGHVIAHRLRAPYPERPPWDRGTPFLSAGFALGAEAGSFMHAFPNYPLPLPAIDLYAEYMVIHNSEMVRAAGGESKRPGPPLIQACQRYGVPTMDPAHKEKMRELAYTKTDHTPKEITDLQDYCLEDDCGSTMRLFFAMLPHLDLLRAPIRGAFMMEIERIRWRGKPIDMVRYRLAERHAPVIVSKMRQELNRKLGAEVYFADVFKRRTMLRLMRQHNIPIPIDPKTGKESCATKLIKSMIETYPPLKDFYEDKRMIDAIKNLKLEIGSDGRNRSWLNPFGTKTGRNNPSTNRELPGLPHTMRSFMKPGPGMAIAQVDIGNEEIGIAAALSGDPVLMEDYRSGDPYLQFAAAALGVLKPTKQQRQVYKSCVLGRIYGVGPDTFARNLGISKAEARQIIDQMTARYSVLNAWLERIQVKAAHGVPITCVLGWSLKMTGKPGEERTFLNYPMQANAAELMRLIIVRAGHLPLIGCAHDSFIVEDTIERIEQTVAELREIICQASRDLLRGFELRADYKPETDCVRYPDRFVDEREREDGMRHWNLFMTLIEEANDEYVGLCDPGQGAASPDEKDEDTAISEDAAEVGVQGSMGQIPVPVD